MTNDELLAAIAQNYPEWYGLLNKPGIFDVFNQAFADPNHPWTAAQITEAIHQTDYYKNTPDTQRQWDILSAVDPASAQQRRTQMGTQVDQIASEMGVSIIGAQRDAFIDAALGGAFTSADIKSHLGDALQQGYVVATGSGLTASGANSVRQLASEYGVPLSDETVNKWAYQLAAGTVDQNAVQGYMQEQAKSLYPGLAAAIDSGLTVRQYADPYAQLAVKELGINPNDFNLLDPKWAAPLQQIDPKTGERTAQTLAAWQSTLRSDPRYGYDTSTNGRDQAAQFATQLAQQFGALA